MTDPTTLNLWQQACQILQTQISPSAYKTWITSNPLTDYQSVDDRQAIATITSPTAFHATNIEKNFSEHIRTVLQELTGQEVKLEFHVGVARTEIQPPPQHIVQPAQTESVSEATLVEAEHSDAEQNVPNVDAVGFLDDDELHEELSLSPAESESLGLAMSDAQQAAPTDPTFRPAISNVQERLKQFAHLQSQTQTASPPVSPTAMGTDGQHNNGNTQQNGYSQQNGTSQQFQQQQFHPSQQFQHASQPQQQPQNSPFTGNYAHTNTQNVHPYQQSPQPPRVTNFGAGELFSQTTIQTMTVDRALLQAQKAGLRLDYTFETFAVSTTNEMAHAAALAVSSQPGTAYNPLFIYGGVGVGKTHLMHAVGNNILKNNPETKVLYCTGEDFTNEIVNAIQNKKALQFKEKYRTVDVLLLDDVQFIAGKNSVQEEFFHTFNTITKRFGQVILTSDRPPHEIALLEDRLRSRFEAGLMVDIQQPSFELRTAILLIKANASHMQLPMNLAQIIASRIDSARKLEGIIKTLKSEVELKHRQIDSQLIDEICKIDLDKPKQRLRVKPYEVIKAVADYYHIKQVVIKGQQRIKSIVRARHVAMYVLKEDLGLPFVEIGRWFSNRDHTSAMHACTKIENELSEDIELAREVGEIRQVLNKLSK